MLRYWIFVVAQLFCLLRNYPANALWPIPRSLVSGSTAVRLSPYFSIQLEIQHPPADIVSAAARTQARLVTDTFERLVLGRGSADLHLLPGAHVLTSLTLVIDGSSPVQSIAEETNQPIDSKSESYSLSISHRRTDAIIKANSTLGLFRGLTTFEQLWYDGKGVKYMLNGDIEIADEPAFVRLLLLCLCQITD